MRPPNTHRAGKMQFAFLKKRKQWSPGSLVRAFREGLLASCGTSRDFVSSSSIPLPIFFPPVFPTVCLPFTSVWSRCCARMLERNPRTKSWMFWCWLGSVCASLTPQLSIHLQSRFLTFSVTLEGSRLSESRVNLKCFGKMTMGNPDKPFFPPSNTV